MPCTFDHPLPDYLRPGVHILLVGINPGLRSAEVGHHFAGRSNRFWKLLHEARLIPRPLTYQDDWRLPEWGLGLTNLVHRATRTAGELTAEDFEVGKRRLRRCIRRYRPRIVALVGVTLYRHVFPITSDPRVYDDGAYAGRGRVGFLPGVRLEGSQVCVLPNPSGRNVHYAYSEMVRLFRRLSQAAPLSARAACP